MFHDIRLCVFEYCSYLHNYVSKRLSLHRDGQCPEYSGEEEAICAVGLVKAKPGIFVEAIQYLLILATPVEVIVFSFPRYLYSVEGICICVCIRNTRCYVIEMFLP